MSLLTKEGSSNSNTISDCLGKAGFCDYVSDVETNVLYRKITLYNNDGSKYVYKEKEEDSDSNCKCGQGCDCSSEENTLKEILKIVKKIEEFLEKYENNFKR